MPKTEHKKYTVREFAQLPEEEKLEIEQKKKEKEKIKPISQKEKEIVKKIIKKRKEDKEMAAIFGVPI